MPEVTFLPGGQRVSVNSGATILDAYLSAGLPPFSDCGGMGTCGKCQVRVYGEALPPNSVEHDLLSPIALAAGFRLACQLRIYQDMRVAVAPLEKPSQSEALMAEKVPELELEPAVQRMSAVTGVGEKEGYETVFFDDETVDTRPATGQALLGVVLDIGTTTITGYLLNLGTGRQEAALAASNPQAVYGADVISRIAFANAEPDGLAKLQSLCLSTVNRLLTDLTKQAHRFTDEVFHIIVVGNPTMIHMVLGVNPAQIAIPPYQPSFKSMRLVRARKLSLQVHPSAKLETLPLVSGYVGADSVAMALFLQLNQGEENRLALDVGTNGEILLSHQGHIYACSTAASPAFEGARISCGMRAQPGAIESFSYDPATEHFHYQVIGRCKALGLCGSGVVSTIASLLDAGIILPDGKFAGLSNESSKLRDGNSGKEFLLVSGKHTEHGNDIVLIQRDIREFQLAKAAVAAGTQRLLDHVGLEVSDLDRIYIAGAFGFSLDPRAARRVGLLPFIELSRVKYIGNAAGSGGKMVLLSKKMREMARKIVKEINYLELSGDAEFDKAFLSNMGFPDIWPQ